MMKSRISVLLRLVLGALFIVSAYSKLISPGLIEIILVDHGLAGSREAAAAFTRILIGIEFAVGLLFLQPFSLKKIVIPVSVLFLALFTLYLGYTGFILNDMQNCGCFGELIKMSPVESIIKNIAMIALLVILFKWSDDRKNYFIAPLIAALSVSAVFMIVPVKSQKDFKFAEFTNFTGAGRVDLSRGDKLIAVMNTECDHCELAAKELAGLKKKMKWLPELYTLYFSEGSITADSFRVMTKYDSPYTMINTNQFLNLIGQSPPRIYWLKDGVVKEIWDRDFVKNITLNFSPNSVR